MSNTQATRDMRTTVPPWPVVGALAQRELVRFLRQRNRVFGALVQPIIFWLLFGAGLGSAKVEGNSLGYAHFFPGTLVMILLFTAIFATISIIEDRKEGFLQGVLVAPVARWAMVLGKVLGGASIAMLQGIVFLLLGWLAGALGWYTVLSTTPLGVFASLLLMFVIAIALTGLGFVIAWRMDSTQGFHAIMSVFLLPMWLLSGAFFPVPRLVAGIGWDQVALHWCMRINPVTYIVAGTRQLLYDDSMLVGLWTPSAAVSWSVTIAFAGVMFALACWIAGHRVSGDLQ